MYGAVSSFAKIATAASAALVFWLVRYVVFGD
jgi:hypothetical protein